MATPSVTAGRLLTRARGREKPQLSCDFCRRRKLRCDRKQPCQSCIKLRQASACSFPIAPSAQGTNHAPGAISDSSTLQDRINHLETLVRTLAEKQQDKTVVLTPESITVSEPDTTTREETTLTSDFGRIRMQKDVSSYVESDHWTAILEQISDLRDMANGEAAYSDGAFEEETQTLLGADLFFLPIPPITKMEVIAALPSRDTVDSLIAQYFRTADMPATLIIHRRVFFKQYETFWLDPLGTPTMWITILIGMMYIVAYCALNLNAGGIPITGETQLEYENIVLTYREKMIQCLRLANYMNGTPHTIEALLVFIQTEYVNGLDAQQGCWQLMGTIVRVAQKMGYHRDGSHFPDMSPFEAEMRRRTWYILIQFDIATASSVGLPRTIKESQCDTAEPRNLLDDDFDDTTTVLPPARPFNEHTLCQFLIYKSRIVTVYGMICDFTTSSKQRNYDEAMRLDVLLHTAFTQKPSNLEVKPLNRSIMDGTELITRRLYIAMSFYHAQMTLHRKFMLLAKTNGKFSASHTKCLEAAFSCLKLQVELFEHLQPGRMLYADRWKILGLILSEFLLAAIILCYNLDDDITHARQGRSPLCTSSLTDRTIQELKIIYVVWEKQQEFCKEARSAVKAISAVLAKAGQGVDLPPKETPSSRFTGGPSIKKSTPIQNPFLFQRTQSLAGVPASTQLELSIELGQTGAPQQGTDPNAGLWNEFFDLDQSWDEWMQL